MGGGGIGGGRMGGGGMAMMMEDMTMDCENDCDRKKVTESEHIAPYVSSDEF